MRHFRARRLHTSSNRMLISLLSADFILLVNCYMNVYQGIVGAPVLGTIGNTNIIYTKLFSFKHFFIKTEVCRDTNPSFSILGCQASGFLGSVAALAQIWSIAAVSYDRFKGIHYPLDSQKRMTNTQVHSGFHILPLSL